jgi:hypothetical protein
VSKFLLARQPRDVDGIEPLPNLMRLQDARARAGGRDVRRPYSRGRIRSNQPLGKGVVEHALCNATHAARCLRVPTLRNSFGTAPNIVGGYIIQCHTANARHKITSYVGLVLVRVLVYGTQNLDDPSFREIRYGSNLPACSTLGFLLALLWMASDIAGWSSTFRCRNWRRSGRAGPPR